MLAASKPGRQEPDALQGISHGQSRHGNPAQFIPDRRGWGVDNAGVTYPVLRMRNHIVQSHSSLSPHARLPRAVVLSPVLEPMRQTSELATQERPRANRPQSAHAQPIRMSVAGVSGATG